MQISDDVKQSLRGSMKVEIMAEIVVLRSRLLQSLEKNEFDLNHYEAMDYLVFLGMFLLGLENAGTPGQTTDNNIYLRFEKFAFDVLEILVVRYR